MQNFKTKVLLVEDEELARKTLTFYLNTVFDEVVTACDGAEALEIIKESFSKKENFDLIISDLNMPNLNGMQMIDEILKLLPVALPSLELEKSRTVRFLGSLAPIYPLHP